MSRSATIEALDLAELPENTGQLNGHGLRRVVRRDRARLTEDGKPATKPKIVHISADADVMLTRIAKELSRGQGRVFESDIFREALDNFFEAHGVERLCGTVRQLTPDDEAE